MRLLVFGKTGQVARELARRLPEGVHADFVGREQADLLYPHRCRDVIAACEADAVINAAAWTAVDAAESAEEMATTVNATAPATMAKACAERSLPFLHISTDYVFDGRGVAPLTPDDNVAPQSAYGRSKLRGEVGVRKAGGSSIILRTSWVFSAHGSNFVKTMLRLGRERSTLRVVADQIGGPTPASAVADALISCSRSLLEGVPGGTHHFAGSPDVSWAEFARAIFRAAGLDCSVDDIESAEYPQPAERPRNSRLDCRLFTDKFGVDRPDWRVSLAEVIRELGAK